MKLELKKIEVTNIEGEKEVLDFGYKGLANYIFNKTTDLGELEMARELYNTGSLELDKERAIPLRAYIGECFNAVVQEALFPILDKIINEEK